MKNAERPKIVDKSDPRYFSIKTRGVRAFTTKADDGSDRFLIEGIASSSVTDRMGDILTETCQASMLSQARGLTMWLNHSYNVPEDIAGTCVDPTLQRATDDGGAACLDLAITLEVDPLNPRALQAWKSVDRGTRLAFSIGGYFKDFDFDADSFGLIVNDIELLEISLVGIPANPRAYTKAFEVATEALKAEVVKRAESYIKNCEEHDGHADSRDARLFVRKSFGLLADVEEVETMTDTENTVPDEQCSVEGCENPAKTFEGKSLGSCGAKHLIECLHEGCEEAMSLVGIPDDYQPEVWSCKDHRAEQIQVGLLPFSLESIFQNNIEATATLSALKSGAALRWTDTKNSEGKDIVVLEAFDPVIKAVVTDEHQQAQIVECMKCIKNAVEAPGHQMCTEPQAHAKAAHSILKAMLPDEYGLPDDATMAAPDPDTKTAADTRIDVPFGDRTITVSADSAKLAKETAEFLADYSAKFDNISSEIEQLTAQKTALETENAELERKKAELLATPTGRKSVNTASNPGGSSKGSEPTIPIELYYKDRHELRNAAATK